MPDIRSKAGRYTFTYFLPKFINLILRNSISFTLNEFKHNLHNNIKIFLGIFDNFFNFKSLNNINLIV